jgi:ATP-binding cassette subfamily A (ABC1) protein 3
LLKSLLNAANIIKWVLRIFFPSFNLGQGLFTCINIDTLGYLQGAPVDAFSPPVLLYEVIFLALQTVVYLVLAVVIDKLSTNPRAVSYWRLFLKIVTCGFCRGGGDNNAITTALPEDDDVMAEQERVLAGDANDDLIVLSSLTKIYDNRKLAVNNVSFGIPPGECFGLLGTIYCCIFSHCNVLRAIVD